MESMMKRTLQIPFTDKEWQSLSDAMFRMAFKKQGYVRNLIIADMKKNGWLSDDEKPQNGDLK